MKSRGRKNYQIFYIDPEEEITTIIGRFRHATSPNIALVVPHRAILSASMINMRILKRSTEQSKKDVLVVTQDEQALEMAKKVGFDVEESLEGIRGEKVLSFQDPERIELFHHSESQFDFQEEADESRQSAKRAFGGHSETSSVVDVEDVQRSVRSQQPQVTPLHNKPAISIAISGDGETSFAKRQSSNRQLPTTRISQPISPRRALLQKRNVSPNTTFTPSRAMDATPLHRVNNVENAYAETPHLSQPISTLNRSPQRMQNSINGVYPTNQEQQEKSVIGSDVFFQEGSSDVRKPSQAPKQQKNNAPKKIMPFLFKTQGVITDDTREQKKDSLKELFRRKDRSSRTPSQTKQPSSYRSKETSTSKKFFIPFFAVGIICLIGAGFLLFSPKAIVALHPKTVVENKNFHIVAQEGVKESSSQVESIPLTLVDVVSEKTASFEATGVGSSDATNQYAKGIVTLYNEYSDSDQPLVATTRLLSADGLLFRTTKTIIVPGYTQKEGKIIPGKIDVEVKADAVGAQYNIGPATFSVPGFKGTAKEGKFYAKSSDTFHGGFAPGQIADGQKVISGEDIQSAKDVLLEELKQQVIDEFRQKAIDSRMILQESVVVELLEASSSPPVGAATQSFEYRIRARFTLPVFSSNHLKESVLSTISRTDDQGIVYDPSIQDVSYRDIIMYSEEKKMQFTAQYKILWIARIDPHEVQKEIVGKKVESLQSVLQSHPEIEKMDLQADGKLFFDALPGSSSRLEIQIVSPE